MAVTFPLITITDATNATVEFHTTESAGNIARAFFYFAAAPGTDPDEPFGYTNSVRSVTDLGGGTFSATFSPQDAGVDVGQIIYFTGGIQRNDNSFDRGDDSGLIPFPPPVITSISSNVDEGTGEITFTMGYINGPSTASCFMWRYLNNDFSSPLIYSENFFSDDGSTVIVKFNPYLETGTLPTDGAIAYNALVAPGSCSAVNNAAPYDFIPPPPPPPPDVFIPGLVRKAPNWQLSPDFVQQDLQIYTQRDRISNTKDISGPEFR